MDNLDDDQMELYLKGICPFCKADLVNRAWVRFFCCESFAKFTKDYMQSRMGEFVRYDEGLKEWGH